MIMTKMSKAEYAERKARLDAGEGSDDDRRLVELYAPHFEDTNLEDAVVHTSEQQAEADSSEISEAPAKARARSTRQK